VVNHQ